MYNVLFNTVTNVLGCVNPLLLYSDQQHVSAIQVAMLQGGDSKERSCVKIIVELYKVFAS
jgi:hypothetical protein